MSSHGSHFLLAISLILRSKNVLLVLFLWKDFRSLRLFETLYFLSSLLHLLSHQLLEYLVILVSFMFLFHALSTLLVRSLIMFSNIWMSKRLETFKFLIILVVSSKNWAFLSLSFLMLLLHVMMTSSEMGMVTVKGAWSEEKYYSGWMKWLLRAEESHWMKIRSMVEFESLILSAYLVGIWLVGTGNDKSKESAKIIKLSLMDE